MYLEHSLINFRWMLRAATFVFAVVALLPQHANGQRPHEPVAFIGWTPPPSPQYDVPPILLSGRSPIYPITRLQQGQSGDALIAFIIDEHGIPRNFRVIRSRNCCYA
jgi:outer membrane biosynthesis protein TonB